MPNRLSTETSLYLLQHADNPVDWQPWSDTTLAMARRENKPILLSIGYSACHWCHVMARESFADPATAELMNRHFVNIKVDREERPDIDRIYQIAHQLLTQNPGGWPLTMFLQPDNQHPFFGGTYFPKTALHGLPAFKDMLREVADYFTSHRDEIRAQGEQILDVFEELNPPQTAVAKLDRAPLDAFQQKVADSFDREHGGMGRAPKFPQTSILNGLLRRWRASANTAEPNLDALFMLSLSLTRMADGGIFDHVGGGFFRYSVDRYWEIPHFEKMLYDNGSLIALYAQAATATGDQRFASVASSTADWVLREMQSDNGGFFSSLDADTDGEEGRYYVWQPTELRALMEESIYTPFAARFGLEREPNMDDAWHLRAIKDVASVAEEQACPTETVASALRTAQATLLAQRQQRRAPERDEKQLVSWNALAIRGLAIAGRALDKDDLISAAHDACHFIYRDLFRAGRLRANSLQAMDRYDAYLDDYAYLLDALLEMLQARWDTTLLHFATELADSMLGRFDDYENGGFYFTADDHEKLIVRSKPFADDAMPAANGIASLALQRLGYLLNDTRYLAAAERTLTAAYAAMLAHPHGHASLLDALEEYLSPPELIIIRGPASEALNWQHSIAKLYAPRRLVFAIPEDSVDLPKPLADKPAVTDRTIAYRCVGMHCAAPIETFAALTASLSETTPPR